MSRAEARITKARAALIFGNPFFGCLVLHLETIESEDHPTMATDGRRLYWNAEFVNGLTDLELQGVLAHEVLHCAYRHHTRRQNRQPLLWNIAADFAINRDLMAAGFALPKGALLDKKFGEAGAEEIYCRLEKSAKKLKLTGTDPGGCGAVLDAPADCAGQESADQMWEIATRQALSVAKTAGNLPAYLQRLVETLNAPRVDWRETLRRFIDSAACRDYSWTRPNRRHLGSGLILPGLINDGVDHVVCAVDTSGSIGAEQLRQFGGEIRSILDDGAVSRITVIYADARVQAVETFEQGDIVRLHGKGGGGTDFADTFRAIARDHADASAVVYLTDLAVWSFGEDPGIPVLWAYYGPPSRTHHTPFGEVVAIGDGA